jgi:hypothetical protein
MIAYQLAEFIYVINEDKLEHLTNILSLILKAKVVSEVQYTALQINQTVSHLVNIYVMPLLR